MDEAKQIAKHCSFGNPSGAKGQADSSKIGWENVTREDFKIKL